MRAAILAELNAPLIVDEVEVPALGPGQVLVKIMASGICGAQINEIAGTKGPDKYLPHLLGHEGSGVVESIGPEVAHVKPGDRVVLHWRKGKGIESSCPKYNWGDRVAGGGWVTTFSEYSVVSENRLTVIPDDTPFDIAALMGCAVTTGLGVVFNDAKLKAGQSILVIGCGGVGLSVIQGARAAKAKRIVGVDLYPAKLAMARENGATETFVIASNLVDYINQVDIAVDTTGRPAMIELAYELTGPGGKTIMVGQPKAGEPLIIANMLRHFKGKALMDSCGGQTQPNEDIPAYLAMNGAGLLSLEKLITHRYPLGRINEALALVRSGQAGRVILEMA